MPALPRMMRHFALSPDRRRVAYSEENKYPSEIFVATFGGETTKIATLSPNIQRLQWTADGQGLIYVDTVERRVPGAWSDWDLPKYEILAHRVMRLPMAGGEPEVLLTSEGADPLLAQVSPARSELFVAQIEPSSGGTWSAIRRLDLVTGEQADVLNGPIFEYFMVSPDGATLVVSTLNVAKGHKPEYQVLDLATGALKPLGGGPAGTTAWTSDGTALIVVGHAGSTLTVQHLPLAGNPPAPKTFPLPPHPVNGDPQFAMISPDGRHVAAYYGDRNVVISLETGEMKTLDSFGGYWCWLDARTLMAAYQGGQYAVTVPD